MRVRVRVRPSTPSLLFGRAQDSSPSRVARQSGPVLNAAALRCGAPRASHRHGAVSAPAVGPARPGSCAATLWHGATSDAGGAMAIRAGPVAGGVQATVERCVPAAAARRRRRGRAGVQGYRCGSEKEGTTVAGGG